MMLRISRHKILLFVHDIIIIIGCIVLSAYICFSSQFIAKTILSNGLVFGYVILIISVLASFILNHQYKYQVFLDISKHTVCLLKSLLASMFSLVFISFVFDIQEIILNRFFLAIIFFLLGLIFFLSRVLLIPNVYYWLVRTKKIVRTLLIIGAGEQSVNIVKRLKTDIRCYFHICGFLDDDEGKQGKYFEGIPVLGKVNDLEKIVKKYNVDELLISISNISYHKLSALIELCRSTKRTLHIISALYSIVADKLEIEEISGISAFRFMAPQHENTYLIAKRILDIAVALSLIVILFPVWLIIAILIRITSTGPAIYKSEVVGNDEKVFTWYKFRTMYYNCDNSVHVKSVNNYILNQSSGEKIKNDSRITPLGKVLRKYSIDEFPQLINVLKGEMSLVGPRPKSLYEFELMEKWQKRRFTVVSGMTGPWQITGRNEVKFNDEIVLDIYYIENRSLKFDFEILLKTLLIVISGKGGS